MSEHVWSRRRFMIASAATVAVATVAPQQAPALDHIRNHWVGYDDFKVLEGQRVRLVGASGLVLNARVIDVRDNSTTHRGVTLEQVSVLMRTGLSERVADHTFRIEHPEWGSCRLFCSPVFSTSRGIQYEATISRLAD